MPDNKGSLVYMLVLHYTIWDWINRTGNHKVDWPGWKYLPMANNSCFLCEAAEDCTNCHGNVQAKAASFDELDMCLKGLYGQYQAAYYVGRRTEELSTKIRDLAWQAAKANNLTVRFMELAYRAVPEEVKNGNV